MSKLDNNQPRGSPQRHYFQPQNYQNEPFQQPQQPQRQNFQQQNYQNEEFQQPAQNQLQRRMSQRSQIQQQPQQQQVAQGQQTNVSVPQRQYQQQNGQQNPPQQNPSQRENYQQQSAPQQNSSQQNYQQQVFQQPVQQGAPQQAPQQNMPPPQPGPQGTPRPSQAAATSRLAQTGTPRSSQLENRRASRDRRFFLSSVGIRVKTLSYEGFARVYFEFGTTEKDLSKQYLNKCLRFTPKEITSPLLKNLYGVKTTWMVVTIFAHILAYMELIPGVPTKFKHAYQILSAGISRPDLRDEIYCQLCKQTNYNMNEEKDKKGWELLLLCCSSFPPSKDFLPALEGHFQQVAGGAVKGFKGDGQAQRCLERLQRVAKAGPRYFLPSHDEIEAIRMF